jgi:hypothetical protein
MRMHERGRRENKNGKRKLRRIEKEVGNLNFANENERKRNSKTEG